jgi:hypothetical protein
MLIYYKLSDDKMSTEKEEKEIHHLEHMETTIVPILVSLGIVGLTFYIQFGKNGILENVITLYLLVFPMALAIMHLKFLISGKIKDRLGIFFVDATFLIIVVSASIVATINYGLLRLNSISLELFLATAVEVIITCICLWYILIKKIKPAFDTNIFPTLCKKYKLLKYKKSQSKR